MTKEIAVQRSPEEWAAYISESWQKAVESIIETGRRLQEAKKQAGHGNWLKIVELLPYSEATTRYLMQIASNKIISDRHHGDVLPASWRTLATLAQLPSREIASKIKSGEITPELQRSTVEKWVRAKKPTPLPDPEPEIIEAEIIEDEPDLDQSIERWREENPEPEAPPLSDWDSYIEGCLESLESALAAIEFPFNAPDFTGLKPSTVSLMGTEFTKAKDKMAALRKLANAHRS